MQIARDLLRSPVTAHTDLRRYPALLKDLIQDRLTFRPAPPGDNGRLSLPTATVTVDLTGAEFDSLAAVTGAGVLNPQEVSGALAAIGKGGKGDRRILGSEKASVPFSGWEAELEQDHQLDRLGLLAIVVIDRLQQKLLSAAPLTEIHFELTERAKAALTIGWEAILQRGQFPLRPRGARRFIGLRERPCGAMHFVSASDLDAGYFYTMGIALSPEAQALQTMDVTYGLDVELIVPGRAVSPIPPFLAMATRLFAASIPTSSNISEEVQSIPIRGRLKPAVRPQSPEELVTDLRQQLSRYLQELNRNKEADPLAKLEGAPEQETPAIGAVFEVTGMTRRAMVHALKDAFAADPELDRYRRLVALYLNIEPTGDDRVGAVEKVIDAASGLGLRYVAVADDAEDSWLPNLLEYLEPAELNDIADHADPLGVIVTDGRPVDAVYTAATAAQRIQSVYTTLSVDILKMGMWLCLDALTARKVWREILSNPHIPSQMLLMPIGIVEPGNAFCDNRDTNRTPRAILEPFEKIKFMIEEAEALKMPSLLTDTRHKATWVLLGRKTAIDEAHLGEKFVYDAAGEIIGRTKDSARPLLSWEELMDCERMARRVGVLLGQAGSVEIAQLFNIISETTLDAAREGKNPATAVWTAETERVLRTEAAGETRDLQAPHRAAVSPFLAVYNRGLESHAKLDGWLRFLEEDGAVELLRADLAARRGVLHDLLETLMGAQRGKGYQKAFDDFRAAYLVYHNLIRDNFVPVMNRVAGAWRKADAAQA